MMPLITVRCKCGATFQFPSLSCKLICHCGFVGTAARLVRLKRVRDAGIRQRWVVRALKTRGALPVVVDQLLNSPETRPTLRKYVAALLNECGCDYQTALKELSKRFPD